MFAQPGHKKKELKPEEPAAAFADKLEDLGPAPEVKAIEQKAAPEHGLSAPAGEAKALSPAAAVFASKLIIEEVGLLRDALRADEDKAEHAGKETSVRDALRADEDKAEHAGKETSVRDALRADEDKAEHAGKETSVRDALRADERRIELIRKEVSKLEEKAHREFEKSVAAELKRISRPQPAKRIIHSKGLKKDKQHKTGPEGDGPGDGEGQK